MLLPDAQPLVELISHLFNKYVLSDWNYVGYLITLIVLDTLTGLYAAWRTSWIVSFRLRAICEKIWYYFVALVVVHVVSAHQVDGEINKFFELAVPMFKGFMYFALIFAEVLSIDENADKVGRAFLPKALRKKIKTIKETGEIPIKDLPEIDYPYSAKENATATQEQAV
jgi:phage-related holin